MGHSLKPINNHRCGSYLRTVGHILGGRIKPKSLSTLSCKIMSDLECHGFPQEHDLWIMLSYWMIPIWQGCSQLHNYHGWRMARKRCESTYTMTIRIDISIYGYIYIYIYIHTLHYITLHYITLHYITLHYIHTYILHMYFACMIALAVACTLA